MESNLSWMFMLVRYSPLSRKKSLKREYFRAIGAQVELYRGVTDWFARDSVSLRRGDDEHYIISSGLKEIIEGRTIAKNFKTHFTPPPYLYTTDGRGGGPRRPSITRTRRSSFSALRERLLEKYDERVNDSMPEENLRIPYENIVYIGDSATDIPCYGGS